MKMAGRTDWNAFKTIRISWKGCTVIS